MNGFSYKKIYILISFLLILLVALSIILIFNLNKSNGDDYYAVYLNTGDVYFGKMSNFPSLELSDVWYLQTNKDGKLSLNKFSKSVFWGPEDKIKINKDKVVWTVKLKKTSSVYKIISSNGTTVNNNPAVQLNTSTSSKLK